MSWLGVWLIGIGLADLVRAGAPAPVARWSPAVGAGAIAVLAVLAGLTAPMLIAGVAGFAA